MKTFSTSGTGSGQTLSEIESDKIPIYDSLTDVEADLANLEVGQIVATRDEGSELSAPVDTVQSGNMHAVTSNAVAEMLSALGITRITMGVVELSVGINLNVNINTGLTTLKHISITPSSNAGYYVYFYVTRSYETNPTVNVTYNNNNTGSNARLTWIAFGD